MNEQTVREAKALARQFRSFLSVAEALEQIEDLTQAEKERWALAEKARVEQEQAQRAAEQAKETVRQLEEQNEKLREEAARLISVAQHEAGEITRNAAAQANVHLQQVRSENEARVFEIEKTLTALRAESALLQTQCEELEKKKASLQKEFDKLRAKFE